MGLCHRRLQKRAADRDPSERRRVAHWCSRETSTHLRIRAEAPIAHREESISASLGPRLVDHPLAWAIQPKTQRPA
jgi:hypothetical protein